MTEKLARRGTEIRTEYVADFLDRVLVRDAATHDVVTIRADQPLSEVRSWLSKRSRDTTHQGFPVVDVDGALLGLLTRRELLDGEYPTTILVRNMMSRAPVVVFDDNTLREAADHMVRTGVGRLPVVTRAEPYHVVGILSRSDLLTAHGARLDAALVTETPPIGRRWIRRVAARQRGKSSV